MKLFDSIDEAWTRHRGRAPSVRSVQRAAVAYLLSRVFVLTAGAVSVSAWAVMDRNMYKEPTPGLKALGDFFAIWDGHWYMEIARSGYPREIMDNVTYHVPEARAAFFPLFPRLVHYLDNVFPGGPIYVGVVVNLALGALLVYLVGCLSYRLFSDSVAEKAMILTALFPGSFVLGWTYSEALLMTLACASLLALNDRRWLSGGLLALLAGLTRPNALAVTMACGVAALLAIKRDREWRALLAPLIAPLGFVGFMLFLARHTGEALPWFRVQREAWDEGTSFGARALLDVLKFLTDPFSSPTNLLTFATIGMLAWLLWIGKRFPLPGPINAYSFTILFMMLLPATVTARPRFLFTAFPLFISWARFADEKDEDTWMVTLVLLSVALTAITSLYGVRGAVP